MKQFAVLVLLLLFTTAQVTCRDESEENEQISLSDTGEIGDQENLHEIKITIDAGYNQNFETITPRPEVTLDAQETTKASNEEDEVVSDNLPLQATSMEKNYRTTTPATEDFEEEKETIDSSDEEATTTADEMTTQESFIRQTPEVTIQQLHLYTQTTREPITTTTTTTTETTTEPSSLQDKMTEGSLSTTEANIGGTENCVLTLPPSDSTVALTSFDYQSEKIQRCEVVPQAVPCGSNDSQDTTWFFDRIEKGCLATSDCIRNENSFRSEEECQATCLPDSPLQRCLDPPLAGYAQCAYNSASVTSSEFHQMTKMGTMQMAYFDKTTERCSWFVFLGCGGSKNQFASIDICRETCESQSAIKQMREHVAEICRLPPRRAEDRKCEDVGQCITRWYFDAAQDRCLAFGYSQSGGTPNNFVTKSSCEKFCGGRTLTQEEICNLPMESGDCRSENFMWFHTADGCHRFNYSGCGGNENRFISEAACMETCRPKAKIIEQDPPSVTASESTTSSNADREDEDASFTDMQRPTTTPITDNQMELMETTQPPGIPPRTKPKKALVFFPEHKYNLTNFTPLSIDLEPCRHPAVYGSCRPIGCRSGETCRPKRLLRWFFNSHTSNCEAFTYSGCSGDSLNVYDSAQSCVNACKMRIMRPERERRCDNNPKLNGCYTLPLPQMVGKNETGVEAAVFAFSVASGTCKAFHLKTNNKHCKKSDYFTDGQECLRSCRKSSPTEEFLSNRCFARKQTFTSKMCSVEHHNVSRWSYLPDLRQCILFSECQPDGFNVSNFDTWGNNFQTKELCQATCMPRGFIDVCRLPKDTGPCSRSHTRYFFNPGMAQCELFTYGGCLGNHNRFITKAECEDACLQLLDFYETGTNRTRKVDVIANTKQKSDNEIPVVPAEVYDEMRRITAIHSEPYPWDFCLQQHTYGTCPHRQRDIRLTRYFYNRQSRNCEPYTYTGCGARGNHFDTMALCEKVCKLRLNRPLLPECKPKNITECPNSGLKAWKFDELYGTCMQIEVCSTPYSGPPLGSGNLLADLSQHLHVWGNGKLQAGTFASSSRCYSQCLPKPPSGTDVQSVCQMNPITTVPYGCRSMVTRWYFDAKDGYCRSYVTCATYGNNFADEETCKAVCSPSRILNVCRLPLDHGGCSRFQSRWYYNTEKRVCEQFYYGGCFGNDNRFISKRECDSACTDYDVCRFPMPRRAQQTEKSVERFTFNGTSKKCERFLFSGRIRHGNNFPNEVICRKVCLQTVNLLPVSVKINKISSSMKRISSQIQHLKEQPVIQHGERFSGEFGVKGPCLSSPQLPIILRNETLRNCNPDDVTSELAFIYNSVKRKCELTVISVCLEYPEEPYHFRILGRPIIFTSQALCLETCLES